MSNVISMMQDIAHILFLFCVTMVEFLLFGALFYALVNGAMIGFKELQALSVSIKSGRDKL